MVMHPRRSVAGANFAALQAELLGLLRSISRPANPSGTQAPPPADPAGAQTPG